MAKSSVSFDNNFWKQVAELKEVKLKSKRIENDFIDIAAEGILRVVIENTPKNTGDLAKSWKITGKTGNSFTIGTDLHDQFLQVTNGTVAQTIIAKNAKAMHFFIGGEEFFRTRVDIRGVIENPFIEPIAKAMNIMMEALMLSLIKQHTKLFSGIQAKKITKFNLSKTVGLTGTKRNTRRGRGGSIQKAKTGRKSFKRTLSRRRRTGGFLTSQKTKVKG